MGQSRRLHDGVTVQQRSVGACRRCGFDEGRCGEPALCGTKAFEDVDQAKQHVHVVPPPVPQNANGLRRGRWVGAHGGHQRSDASDHPFWRLQATKHIVHAGPVVIGQEQSEPFIAESRCSTERLKPGCSGMTVNDEVLQDPVFVHHRQGLVGEWRVEQPRKLAPNTLSGDGGQAWRSGAQRRAQRAVDGPRGVVRWWAGCESIDAEDAKCILLKALIGHPDRPQPATAKVASPAVKVDELVRFEINGHRVDRQVTASEVEGDVGHQFHAFRATPIDVGAVDTQGRGLERLDGSAGLEGHRAEGGTGVDRHRSKALQHHRRLDVNRQVNVMRRTPAVGKHVPDAATDQPYARSEREQPVDDLAEPVRGCHDLLEPSFGVWRECRCERIASTTGHDASFPDSTYPYRT